MLKIIILFSLISSTILTTTCPAGAVASLSDSSICYSLVTVLNQYLNAEQTCVDLGGHLASIDSSFANTFLVQQAEKTFKNVNATDFWIGANDLSSSGVWTWTDGKPFTFTDWDTGEPMNAAGADCVSSSMKTGGRWNAQSCFLKKPFICEVPGIIQKTCPSYCPSEWTYFNLTDSCYKVEFDKKWNDAEAVCVSEGAHLVSLHSEIENIFVSNLAHTSLKLSTPHMTWIGLYTQDKNKSWKWTDGSPYDFHKWAHKQPDHDGKENCVQVFSDVSEWPAEENWYQEWNNYNCDKTLRNFVCKKPALKA